MRTLRTLLTALLGAAVLPAQAETLDICDRTPQVRDAILEVLEADDCVAVNSEGIAALENLGLRRSGLTALQSGDFDGLTGLQTLFLDENQLTTLPAGVFDGLTSLQWLRLPKNQLTTLPAGVFESLTSLEVLVLYGNELTTLPAGAFDGLASVRDLDLSGNHLAVLPAGVFDDLTDLEWLVLSDNQLASLPADVFDSLTSLLALELNHNQLVSLPAGVFDGLTGLVLLYLTYNELTTLPPGVFDGLTNLEDLLLSSNQLASLPVGVFDDLTSLQLLDLRGNQLVGLTRNDPLFAGLSSDVDIRLDVDVCGRTPQVLEAILEALRADDCAAVDSEGMASVRSLNLGTTQLETLQPGDFDGLTRLQVLRLHGNQLTTLPAGVFDDLTSLQVLWLYGNRLTTLPAGVFDGLTSLQELLLSDNQLTTLPAGVFDGLASLSTLDLQNNRLVGLTRNDPLFAALPSEVDIRLGGQTRVPPVRLAAAVPLMLSASDSMQQGFVRIINESEESGSVRVFAFDDGGYAPNPIEIQLGASEAFHFNTNDLESGNAKKGIEVGVGGPVQGDWRLDVETRLAVRVLAFVRHGDGFLTAMHDVLPRDDEGRLAAQTFNPGSNTSQASSLRLVNTGEFDESVSIEGVDDQGAKTGPATLTLAAGESRTLSAFDLENGAHGVDGWLGDGAGKWRLFITAGDSVVGVSLLELVSGHLTNISTMGVADD